MLSLRLSEGFSKEKFKKRFGKDPDEEIFKRAEVFEKNGLINITDDRISLTPEGFLLSNTIIGNLL